MGTKHTKIRTQQQSYHNLSSGLGSLSLKIIDLWDVQAGLEYNILSQKNQKQEQWIFLRTFGGKGELFLESGERLICSASTWLLVKKNQIHKYTTISEDEKWHFSWAAFIVNDGKTENFFMTGAIINTPIDPQEAEIVSEIRECIESPFMNELASVCLNRWMLRLQKHYQQNENQNHSNRIVQLACRWLNQNANEFPNVERLAQECFVSSRYLHISFKKVLSCSPKHFLEKRCLTRALNRLLFSNESISEIADAFGYSSPFHFSSRFKKLYGSSPSKVRKGKPSS